MKKLAFGVIVASGVLASSMTSALGALVSTSPSCTNGGALTAMNPNPVACIGSYAGIDVNQQADLLPAMTAAFIGNTGLGTWTYEETVDKFSVGTMINSISGSAVGVLDFVSPMSGLFGIAMMSGPPNSATSQQFSVYLFDGSSSAISSIDYTTIGVFLNGRNRIQDLNTASLYTFTADGSGPSDIPIPASGVLLGFAMVGAGLIAKRRRKH